MTQQRPAFLRQANSCNKFKLMTEYSSVLWFGYSVTIWKDKLTAHLERMISCSLDQPYISQQNYYTISLDVAPHLAWGCRIATIEWSTVYSWHLRKQFSWAVSCESWKPGTYTISTVIRVLKICFPQFPRPCLGGRSQLIAGPILVTFCSLFFQNFNSFKKFQQHNRK